MIMMFPGRRDTGPRCPRCGHRLKIGGHPMWGREVLFCPECGFVDEDGIGKYSYD
tara:strand:- start:285 stop:449 length:165 start_codon:yes stop_codon:yes gene_type:complete